MPLDHPYVLTPSCRDTKGIVHAVSGLLYQAGCNIIDSQQFGDLEGEDATGLFFMRVHFQAPPQLAGPGTLQALFQHTRPLSAEDCTAVGRDIECMVLARAVRWHVEHRVLINAHKCVVFH